MRSRCLASPKHCKRLPRPYRAHHDRLSISSHVDQIVFHGLRDESKMLRRLQALEVSKSSRLGLQEQFDIYAASCRSATPTDGAEKLQRHFIRLDKCLR